MYEFSDKKVREKFKKTEYGKKRNKKLYISIVIAFILFVISCCSFFIMSAGGKILNITQDLILNIIYGITAIAIIIACYFDGKRDVATEQFKIDNKK